MNHSALHLRRLSLSAICLALCLILPLLTGQIPEIGSMLCPMHIPVLLCGFMAGPSWAFAAGLIAPLLRFALFGMPPLFPTGAAMCFELAAYGAVSGLFYRHLPKRPAGVYLSLMGAMLLGRAVWGIAQAILLRFTGTPFPFSSFVAGAFTSAIPGILLQIILIPPLVLALRRALPWLRSMN